MPYTAVIQVRRALLSVSDKTGLIDFARGLHDLGVELVSTGGTFRALNEAGLPAIEVSSVTAFPEMMDGRVKTLHPKIHGGILGRRDVDQQVMEEHGIEAIDLVCVNLYPFKETIANPEKTHDDAIENIDIGGPAMVRSAAKNHQFVGIVTSPHQYATVLGELADGGLSFSTRQQLATAAFQHTAEYDGAIANYLGRDTDTPQYPGKLFLNFERASVLRYGENPQNVSAGKQLIDAEIKRLALGSFDLRLVAESLNLQAAEDLYAAVGAGDVRVSQVVGAVSRLSGVTQRELDLEPRQASSQERTDGIQIRGVGQLLTQIATCCHPVPGDMIVGFITKNRGVSIHRDDCGNALSLEEEHPGRMIEVSWGETQVETYPVEIEVSAYDRQGLLRDVTSILANERVNVTGMSTKTDATDHTARLQLSIEVDGLSQLSQVLDRVQQIHNVIAAKRIRSG